MWHVAQGEAAISAKPQYYLQFAVSARQQTWHSQKIEDAPLESCNVPNVTVEESKISACLCWLRETNFLSFSYLFIMRRHSYSGGLGGVCATFVCQTLRVKGARLLKIAIMSAEFWHSNKLVKSSHIVNWIASLPAKALCTVTVNERIHARPSKGWIYSHLVRSW